MRRDEAPKKLSINGKIMAGSAMVVVMERKKPWATALIREDLVSIKDIRGCRYPILIGEWRHPRGAFSQNDLWFLVETRGLLRGRRFFYSHFS